MATVPRSSGQHCWVIGCRNNDRKRRTLSEDICSSHGVRQGMCGCNVFKLHRFPHDWKGWTIYKFAQEIAQEKIYKSFNEREKESKGTATRDNKRKRLESFDSSDEELTSTEQLHQKDIMIAQLRKRLKDEKDYSRHLGLALLEKIEVARTKPSGSKHLMSAASQASNINVAQIPSTSHSVAVSALASPPTPPAPFPPLNAALVVAPAPAPLAPATAAAPFPPLDAAPVAVPAPAPLPDPVLPPLVAGPVAVPVAAPFAPEAAPAPFPPLAAAPIAAPALARPPAPAAAPLLPHLQDVENLGHQPDMNAGVRAPRNLPPLYEVFQGNIHLGDEVYIAEQKMRHLMKLPSDRRFTKDVMRCLWTVEQLQERRVTGQVSRRLVRSGGVAKQVLTPRKVAAVKNALQLHHASPKPRHPGGGR